MPTDLRGALVRQDLSGTQCRAWGEDECGGWWAIMDGVVTAADAPTWLPAWWAYGRVATALRLDVELSDGGSPGDTLDLQLWQQPQDQAHGVLVWSGTLTLPAAPEPFLGWWTLGACVGPRGDAWGLRVRQTAAAAPIRARFRLVGDCNGTALGTIVRGEHVTP